MPQWLILVHRIPPRPLYLRAKIRQRLADVGAVAVKNAVYLLPHGPDALEDLQWIAQEITSGGGDAHLFSGDFVDGVANDAAIAQFRETRDADYTQITLDARAALKARHTAAELAAVHSRLSRRLEDVRRIDFFGVVHASGLPRGGRKRKSGRRPAPQDDALASAEQALAAIETRLERDQKEESRMPETKPELRGKTWVTRPGVKIDRMASAWFIRRFIDPKARFRFAAENAPRADGEIRFDMVGGDFTHEEDRCTLETLVRKVGLPDKGVRAIAEIVHDLDLKDARYDRPETAGVRIMLDGLMSRTENDDERIDRALPLFDDLHEALGKKRARK